MILRYRRRMLPRGLATRLAVLTAAVLLMFVILFEIVDRSAAPAIIDMAETSVRAASVKAMNDSVRSVMASPLQYTDLVKITQDSQGRITLMQADTVKLDEIATSVALATQDSISKIGRQGVGVPIGSVLGGELLAGRGPDVYARIIPVGAVTTDFGSEFQSEGINQTRHKIYLSIHETVRIVVPTQSKEIDVDTKVLITECIIIGQVPSTYMNVTDLNNLGKLSALPKASGAP